MVGVSVTSSLGSLLQGWSCQNDTVLNHGVMVGVTSSLGSLLQGWSCQSDTVLHGGMVGVTSSLGSLLQGWSCQSDTVLHHGMMVGVMCALGRSTDRCFNVRQGVLQEMPAAHRGEVMKTELGIARNGEQDGAYA